MDTYGLIPAHKPNNVTMPSGGFTDIEKTADLTEGGLVVSPNENNRRAEAFRKMLGVAPKAGTDTHKPNIVDALGKDWATPVSPRKRGRLFANEFRPAPGPVNWLSQDASMVEEAA